MTRFTTVGLIILLIIGTCSLSSAAGDQALASRKTLGLNEFAVPGYFLDGFFMANELNPKYFFGPVKDLVKACGCPTTWLIDDAERQRIGDVEKRTDPLEFSVYLEADCPDRLIYYGFVVQHQLDPEQWLKWRWKFHKSKAEPEYGQTRDRLKKAAQDGINPAGELRSIEINGNLDMRNPEDAIMKDLKLRPVYDLEKGQKITP
ncbi:MAG: hypothetical protein HQK55_13300 [Deltaproteobacteria bacterium]|nr:hypothetical protein [Deltaproteobacteria bacterium]